MFDYELLRAIKLRETTWEKAGFLEQLSNVEKDELTILLDIGSDILVNDKESDNQIDSEIQVVFLPCIRRIYTGLYSWYTTSRIFVDIVIKDEMIDPKNSKAIPFVFSNPEAIHNMLLTKYEVLKKGMSVLTTTDTQAESTALLCDDYIRSVKELVRKDIDNVMKVVNREMLLNEILDK